MGEGIARRLDVARVKRGKLYRRPHRLLVCLGVRHPILCKIVSCETSRRGHDCTHPFRLPVRVELVVVQLGEGGGGAGRRQQGAAVVLLRVPGGIWHARVISIVAMPLICMCWHAVSGRPAVESVASGRNCLRGRSLGWRGIDHELEALLGGRQLRDVVFGMRTTDMLLHGAVALLLFVAIGCQFMVGEGGGAGAVRASRGVRASTSG